MKKAPVHKQSSNGLHLAIWDNTRNGASAFSVDIQRKDSVGEWIETRRLRTSVVSSFPVPQGTSIAAQT